MELTSNGLEFDAARHEYKYKGRTIDSVTQILGAMGLSNYSFATAMHRSRGTAVHDICDLIDEGTSSQIFSTSEGLVAASQWDPGECDPDYISYGWAYAQFRVDHGFLPGLVEHRVYSRSYVVAGTLDRWGQDNRGRAILLDIKSGGPTPAGKVQVCLYAYMLKEQEGLDSDLGMILHLNKEGGKKAIEVELRGEFLAAGLSAVSLHHFRKNYGLTG